MSVDLTHLEILKGRVVELLREVRFQGWRFVVALERPHVYLRVAFYAPDAETGQVEPWNGRKWLLSPRMTDSEIVFTAFKAVMTAVEHETREAFTFKGQAIFGPHFDVHQMAERMAQDKAAMFDVRHAPAAA